MTKKFYLLLCVMLFSTFGSTATLAKSNLEYFFGETGQYEDVLVTHVISADTVKLESGEKIKLIGLRAPAVPKQDRRDIERDEFGIPIDQPTDPETPIEMRSYLFAESLLNGQRVRLEFDTEKKDNSYRTLAYIFLKKNNMFVNEEILKQGFANLQSTVLNTKYSDRLREAYKEAKREHRGLHESN